MLPILLRPLSRYPAWVMIFLLSTVSHPASARPGSPPAAQSVSAAQDTGHVLTNDDVIKMVQAHLSVDLILGQICSHRSKFSLVLPDLTKLQHAGVPGGVISAMAANTPDALPSGLHPSAAQRGCPSGQGSGNDHPSGASATTAPADSQAREQCTAGGPLTMDQVLAMVKHPVGPSQSIDWMGRIHGDPNPFAPTAATIMNCHVSFTMDMATLDKLAGEHLPATVLDAMNKDTSAGLSLEDARREVAAIEGYLHGDDAGATPAWEEARAKIEADYQAKTAAAHKAAQAPKDEFETQAAYQNRVKAANVALDEAKNIRDLKIAAYSPPFTSRIRVLGVKTYPIAAQSEWESYDADTQLLKVQVGGQEYDYSGVTPDAARNYKEHWDTVQTGRKYDDDGTRFLFFTANGSRLLGQTPQRIQEQRAAGVWVDSQTELMWTISTSVELMSAPGATKYCSMLPLAGFSDWKLPTIDELDSLDADPPHRGVKSAMTVAAAEPISSNASALARQGVKNATAAAEPGVNVWSSTANGESQRQPVLNYGGRPVNDVRTGLPLSETKPVFYGNFIFGIQTGVVSRSIFDRSHPGAEYNDPKFPAICVRRTDAGPILPPAPVRLSTPGVPSPRQGVAATQQGDAGQQAQNSPPAPGCDSDISSNVFNTVRIQIQFINQTDSDRKLFWVDGYGKTSSSGSIKRHTTKVMYGHAGWAWLITDENKKCVLRTATPANGQIIITQ